jgi:hypothetical protein
VATIPKGFGPISSDFVPYSVPPSPYGSAEGGYNLPNLEPDLSSTEPGVGSALTSSEPRIPWELVIRSPSSTLVGGQQASISVSISFPSQPSVDKAGHVVTLNTTFYSCSSAPLVSPLRVKTDTQGIATFSVRPQNSSSIPCTIRLEAFLVGAPYRVSNTLTLSVAPGQLEIPVVIPTTPGVGDVPLQEAGYASVVDNLEAQTINEALNTAPTDQMPKGSMGMGSYHNRNRLSPLAFLPDIEELANAYKLIQGFANNQSRRYSSWATDILHKTHSILSPLTTSEAQVIASVIPFEQGLNFLKYVTLVAEAGKFASGVVSSFLPDYSYGHNVEVEHASRHFVSDHFRVQASAVFDINSAAINLVSQQSVSESRFWHLVADLQQSETQYSWSRAEKLCVEMGKDKTNYYTGAVSSHQGIAYDYSGPRYVYSDELIEQVGNEGVPMSPLNSSIIGYGRALRVAQTEDGLYVAAGPINRQARMSVNTTSEVGNINFLANTGNFTASAPLADLKLKGLRAFMYTTTDMHLKSDLLLAIDAPLLLIGMGEAIAPNMPIIQGFSGPIPIPPPIPEPAGLPKEPSRMTTKRNQVAPGVPTPFSFLAGPDLGETLGGKVNFPTEFIQEVFRGEEVAPDE